MSGVKSGRSSACITRAPSVVRVGSVYVVPTSTKPTTSDASRSACRRANVCAIMPPMLWPTMTRRRAGEVDDGGKIVRHRIERVVVLAGAARLAEAREGPTR